MSQQTQLARNTFILAVGKFSTQLASFILLPVYTIFLTTRDYGFVDLALTYITLFIPIVTMQMDTALFRFLVDVRADEAEKKRIISNALKIVIITLMFLMGLYLILINILKIPYLGLIMLNVVATISSNLLLQIARGFGENKKFAMGSIVSGVTMLIASIVLIIGTHMGIAGVLISSLASMFATTIYMFYSLNLRKYIDFKENDMALKKQLLGYSLPLIPNSISWWVINVSDRTIVTIFLGLSANGIYAVSNKFAAIFISIFSVFGMSWTESAALHINAKNRDEFFSDVANTAIRCFGSLGLVMLASIPIIFPLIIGKQYNEALNYIPFLVLAAFFSVIVGIYSAIYLAKKMTKQVMYMSLSSAAINIGLNLILIKFIGIYAAALSTAVAYLAMAIFRHYDLKKFLTITYQKGIFLSLLGAYAAVIVLYYWNNAIGNIFNVLITIAIVILLNKTTIKTVLHKLRSRHA